MKALSEVIKEIEDYTKDFRYKDIAQEYTISELKNAYSTLHIDASIEIHKLKCEISQLKETILKT